MNPTDQPRGNFKMNLNFLRNIDPNAPAIRGTISTPDAPDVVFRYKAFEHVGEKGRYWIGPVNPNRSMRQGLNTTILSGTHFIAIRENGFKIYKERDDGSPNPAYQALTAEQQEKEDIKPAFWATWTRTDAEPQLRAAAWEREPGENGPWASGNVQYPITKEQADAMKGQGQPEFTDREPEPAPAPAPRAPKAKASSHDRA